MGFRSIDKIDEGTLTKRSFEQERALGKISQIVVHRNSMIKDVESSAEFFLDPVYRTGKQQPYHFVIKEDGTVEQGIPLDEIGWAAAGKNTSGIQVCLVGDFRTAPPSAEQIEAFKTLCLWLCEGLNLSPRRAIVRHSVSKEKKCPGKHLHVEGLAQEIGDSLELLRLHRLRLKGIVVGDG